MAAGLGFKDFTTGEVLTAADVDGYLMQGVWVFASAAARDAAVTSPQEGNFAYLKDTNVTTYYTGSAWANLDTTGMTNPMTTTGDIIYSSSGSTPARLGIGSTGNVLTVSGGVPVWSAPAGGGGKVLQVVQGTLTTRTLINSTSPVDTGLTASITPSANTSKVLVNISIAGYLGRSGGTYNTLGFRVLRDATNIFENDGYQQLEINPAPATFLSMSAILSYSYLDSPSTTSSTTYKLQGYSRVLADSYWNQRDTNSTATIILTEIGA